MATARTHRTRRPRPPMAWEYRLPGQPWRATGAALYELRCWQRLSNTGVDIRPVRRRTH